MPEEQKAVELTDQALSALGWTDPDFAAVSTVRKALEGMGIKLAPHPIEVNRLTALRNELDMVHKSVAELEKRLGYPGELNFDWLGYARDDLGRLGVRSMPAAGVPGSGTVPTMEAVRAVDAVIEALSALDRTIGRVPQPEIKPRAEGGVLLVWHGADSDVEMAFNGNGRLTSVFGRKGSQVVSGDPDDAVINFVAE